MHFRAAELIRVLALQPHPEGGHYAEGFRSPHLVTPADGRPARPALTAIHFLLAAGERSAWHVVRSDELWWFVEGDPLDLFTVDPQTLALGRIQLGAPGSNRRASFVVPAGHWQAAQPAGAFTLVGCAVAPGFDYDDFALLRGDAEGAARFRAAHPDLVDLL